VPFEDFMNLRHAIILAITTILLAACNFTLAADITPPPGYVPPTPMPTLGPLSPPSAPDIQNGAAIYAEKCSPCHGATGLGDGEQGKQLPVTVAAFALPETGRKATPAQWFMTVTQGNIDRFMPPFVSLSEQERWDVISYTLTLHTTNEEIEKGKNLFEANCADCTDKFKDQEKMASLSETDLVNVIKKGDSDIPAFGSKLSDDDAYAVAAYLRTLTFITPSVAETIQTTPTTVSAETGTPSAEGTPVEGTAQVEVTNEATTVAGIGTVSGTVEDQTGAALPSDIKVTLRGFDHGADANAGPQEVLTLEGTVEGDGTYKFENVEMPKSRIFLAEVIQDGIAYQSDFVAVDEGTTELTLPNIVLRGTTDDYTTLSIDNVNIHFNFTDSNTVQVFIVYSMRNTSDKTLVVKLENNNNDIPFIKAPANSKGLGFQATQTSAPFLGTQDGNGFAMPPSEQTYGLVAFTDLPRSDKMEFSQKFVLNVESVQILMPEGVSASGGTLTDAGLTPMQDPNGQTVNFQNYSAGSLKANDTLTFTVSGKPEATSSTANVTQNRTLLIGVGAFGLVLIVAGVWLYLRDRNRVEEKAEEEDDEFEDQDSIIDAIIALDDLHRAGKLNDEAYHRRRDELKAKLKE
jgi:mono/diheme cytochrome c family protein